MEPEPLLAAPSPPPPKPPRLASLDIVRGLTVALMIFVDDVGGAYPSLAHSPWDGVTLADSVMPAFLLLTGVSIALSPGTPARVLRRTLRLLLLGLLLQGGGWFSSYSYGYNWYTLRPMGILQRIAFGYAAASLLRMYVPPRAAPPPASHAALLWHTRWQSLLVLCASGAQLLLTYTLYVPSWSSLYGEGGLLAHPVAVECGVRAAVHTPQCTAAGMLDRAVFGQHRLAVWMSARMEQCSPCSPGDADPVFRPACVEPANATRGRPAWCLAHAYDPEGLLPTLGTLLSVWLGVHCGQLLLATPRRALPLHWAALGGALGGGGLALDAAGLRMNKQLWSLSYALFEAGACVLALAAAYCLVDLPPPHPHRRVLARLARGARALLFPFEAMGMNAIFFFFWHGTAEAIINALYVAPPAVGGGLAYPREQGALLGTHGWVRVHLFGWVGSAAAAQLCLVLTKIAAFLAVGCVCHRYRYFWKI